MTNLVVWFKNRFHFRCPDRATQKKAHHPARSDTLSPYVYFFPSPIARSTIAKQVCTGSSTMWAIFA